MPESVCGEIGATNPSMYISKSVRKTNSCLHPEDFDCPVLPGLPDDIAKHCLALVPRSNFPTMGGVSRRWRSFIKSKEFITVRKLAGLLEEWLYVLTMDAEGDGTHWEVLDCFGNKKSVLPLMPGPIKAGFGVVVLNGKLIVMAGYSMIDGVGSVSSDVYQYDSCLNSWSKIANMNVPRYDFACAEVNGVIYAVGGYGMDGESLSCAEAYNPDTNKWTLIESLRRPRWGCFACGFEGKLYVMGGRSSFTIGNSRFVDVYNPEDHSWCEMKNGCVMVTAHAVVGKKLFCMEWKNQRRLAIFNPEDNTWKMVSVPVIGSSSVGFRFGIMEDKLLLFSLEEEQEGFNTLLYDPNAASGSEWQTSKIKPSGLCLHCVTIKMKNGCVMVTAHAVVGKKLFCMEWKNQRRLAIFNPEDNTWKMVSVPVIGSSSVGFRFGIMEDKLLLFSLEEEQEGFNTLLYDPNAAPGSEWQTSKIKPSGLCLHCVTIKA